jgi:hypothetical protein
MMERAARPNRKKSKGTPTTLDVMRSGNPLTVTVTWPCPEIPAFEAFTVIVGLELWSGALKTTVYLPLPSSDGAEKLAPATGNGEIVAPVTICVPFDTVISRTTFPPGETDEGRGTTATVNEGRGLTRTLVWLEPLTKPDLLATTWTVVFVSDVTGSAVKLAV